MVSHRVLTTLVASVLAFRTGGQTIIVVVQLHVLTAVSAAVSSFSWLFATVVHGSLLPTVHEQWKSAMKHYSRAEKLGFMRTKSPFWRAGPITQDVSTTRAGGLENI